MQLRYLITVSLYKLIKTKRPNGTEKIDYLHEGDYSVHAQEISDDVSASIYGADLNQMTRIRSINGELEKELKPKMTNESDNISKYIIVVDDVAHSIKAVKSYVDMIATHIMPNLSL